MKRQYLIFFTLLLSFFTQIVSGQKPCNNFDCAYKKAENFLKQAAYQKALDNLDSAEGYLTDTNTKEKEQIKQLRRRLFVAIEKEKEDAKRARDEAKRQTEIAKNAETKAKAVLDKIYFYESKFGLAYDEKAENSFGAYGFIDKELNTKIEFKYDRALPFEFLTGFAKVQRKSNNFLIDTLGKEYKLSTELANLDSETLAVDLNFRKLNEIPLPFFEKPQIEIMLLISNNLSIVRHEIGQLKKLTYLNLMLNNLKELPSEIANLTNLKVLDLRGNPIPKQEQEKIKKLLPNCKIEF